MLIILMVIIIMIIIIIIIIIMISHYISKICVISKNRVLNCYRYRCRCRYSYKDRYGYMRCYCTFVEQSSISTRS